METTTEEVEMLAGQCNQLWATTRGPTCWPWYPFCNLPSKQIDQRNTPITMFARNALRTVKKNNQCRTFVSKTAARLAGPEKQLPGQPQNAMKKWWAYNTHTNRQITRTLSPFQIDHVGPLFKGMAKNLPKKVTENWLDILPGALVMYGVVTWGNSAFNEDQRSHWS